MAKTLYPSIILAFSFAAFSATSGCTKSENNAADDTDDRPVLAVSVEPQRAWLENIVGDRFRIITMLPSGSNVETYEPTPEMRKSLADAKAYFMVGPLLLEGNLKMSAPDATNFIDTSNGIDPIYGTHNHCADHRSFLPSEDVRTPDPHYWSSVVNARIMTKNMTDQVIAIDPDNADEYRANYERYDAYLDSLDTAYRNRLEKLPNKVFMVWHPSLSYFARDYGLEQLAVGSESKEVSIQSMRHVIDHAISDSVRVFFHQHDYDSNQAQSINAAIGSHLVSINLGAYEWQDEFDNIVDELTAQ